MTLCQVQLERSLPVTTSRGKDSTTDEVLGRHPRRGTTDEFSLPDGEVQYQVGSFTHFCFPKNNFGMAG